MTRFSFYIPFVIFLLLTSCFKSNKKIDEVKLIPVKIDKQFEYIDQQGKIIINPQFSQATVFRDGLALVQTSADTPKWGFIGEDGRYVIPAIYKSATVFGDNLAWVVSDNSAPSAINTKGEIQFTVQSAEYVKSFNEGLAGFAKYSKDGKIIWGFVNTKGETKINPQFSDVGYFSSGKCAVLSSDGKWGYINSDGNITINYQFNEAEPFINGYAVVSSSGKYGVIDDAGKYVINPQFQGMASDGDLFLIQQGGKLGWADKDGKIVINPQFTNAFPFAGNKFAAVRSGDSWGYIDKEGKISINPQFDRAFPFNGSQALVISANKVGFINEEGKYSVNPQFDDASMDLIVYLQNGNSTFNSVESDFFDVNAVTSAIKLDEPEGLTYETPLSVIISKFSQDTGRWFKTTYPYQYQLISMQTLSNDAALNFYFLGNPWQTYQLHQGSGWNQYYTTTYKLDKNSRPKGFIYFINFSHRGLGREQIVKNVIEKELVGYAKDANSSGNFSIYRNAKQTIEISAGGGSMSITIHPGNKTGLISGSAADSAKMADSTKMADSAKMAADNR